jgi:hypothetical protein
VVICFIAWAYSGDYQTEAIGVSSQVLETEASKLSKKGKGGKKSRSMESDMAYHDLLNPTELAPKDINPGSDSMTAQDASSSDTSTPTLHHLLLNVQIYAFAAIYLIEPLKAVAQQKIIAYLQQSEKARLSLTHLMYDILGYASTHLPEDDRLLDWLAKYASWKLAAFRSNKERWNAVVGRDEGKFARLVMNHVVPCSSPFHSENDIPPWYS